VPRGRLFSKNMVLSIVYDWDGCYLEKFISANDSTEFYLPNDRCRTPCFQSTCLEGLVRKNIACVKRILTFDDGTCLGAVYSVKTWFLVLFMIGMGVILRSSSLPMTLLSFIYITIGVGLLASSRHAWRAWYGRT